MNLLAMTGLQIAICFLFVLICVLLIIVVLLQKGRGGGLSGAFGAGGGGHSAFGAKTGDVFTWVTIVLTFAFVLMACVGNYVFVPPPLKETPAPVLTAPQDEGETPAAGDTGENPDN